jgi:hypothetical protein
MKLATFLNQSLLLLALFLVRGLGDADASDSDVQLMSTGETPRAFVRSKIDGHDVSLLCTNNGLLM